MLSIGYWQRRFATALSDEDAIAFDLMSQLNYLAATAQSGVGRDLLMQEAGRQPFRTAAFFRNADLLAKRMGLEYSRALQVVAETAPNETLKRLFLRFSGAVSSGGSEAEFIGVETRVEMERFTARYERNVESLRKWTDAYASLLVCASLIVVVATVSTMLYPIGETFLMVLAFLMVVTVGLGVYVLYRVAPVEQVTTSSGGTRYRLAARTSLLILGPIGLVVALLVYPRYELGGALLVIGLSLIPTGVLAALDAGAVDGFDRDLPGTIHVIGNLAGALGVSPGSALDKIDQRALGTLVGPIQRLQSRLSFQLDPEVCWGRFTRETGSELVRRTVSAFLDAVRLGAPPERAAGICTDFARTVTLLRAKRRMTAATFVYLTIVLHAAMAALLVFMLQIVVMFNQRIATLASDMLSKASLPGMSAISGLPFFEMKDTGYLVLMMQVMVLVFSVANALAPKSCSGGHPLRVFSYVSGTFCLSGIALLVVPMVTKLLFKF
jgi:flagellar protein FlaJ